MAFYKGSAKAKKDDFTYDVKEKCGVLGDRGNDWQLELRLVAYGDNEPKYDIRPWKDTETGEKMGKGITMSGEELEALYEVLKGIAEAEVKQTAEKQPKVAGAKRSRK